MLNRYAYCRNNPLIYVDPTGLAMEDAGDDEGQYGEGPSGGGSGSGENGDGTEAGRNEKNASQSDPGEDEESDTPGKNRKSRTEMTLHGFDDPLDDDDPFRYMKTTSQMDIMMKNMEENMKQPQLRSLEQKKACGRWAKDGPCIDNDPSKSGCLQPMKCVDPQGNVLGTKQQQSMHTIHGEVVPGLGEVCGPCVQRR